MPVSTNKAHLNSAISEWCQEYCPHYLEIVTSLEFQDILKELISIKDVFLAARYFGDSAGVEPNEPLVMALLRE